MVSRIYFYLDTLCTSFIHNASFINSASHLQHGSYSLNDIVRSSQPITALAIALVSKLPIEEVSILSFHLKLMLLNSAEQTILIYKAWVCHYVTINRWYKGNIILKNNYAICINWKYLVQVQLETHDQLISDIKRYKKQYWKWLWVLFNEIPNQNLSWKFLTVWIDLFVVRVQECASKVLFRLSSLFSGFGSNHQSWILNLQNLFWLIAVSTNMLAN